MMMRMLRFQLSRMVRCREYQVAMLLSTLIVCGAFLAETVTNSKVDRSAILSASEVACGYGISTALKQAAKQQHCHSSFPFHRNRPLH